MAALGVIVFPLAAALAARATQRHGHGRAADRWTGACSCTPGCALLAYATLAIAALLAIMLWLQERALRRREFHGWLRALPPLIELESLLFRTIAVGFVLLTRDPADRRAVRREPVRPAPGAQDRAQRAVAGWRSARCCSAAGATAGAARRAVRWTLAAMALLVLAFFGSKFVLELVLASRAPGSEGPLRKIFALTTIARHTYARHESPPHSPAADPPSACCSARSATPCGRAWKPSWRPPAMN